MDRHWKKFTSLALAGIVSGALMLSGISVQPATLGIAALSVFPGSFTGAIPVQGAQQDGGAPGMERMGDNNEPGSGQDADSGNGADTGTNGNSGNGVDTGSNGTDAGDAGNGSGGTGGNGGQPTGNETNGDGTDTDGNNGQAGGSGADSGGATDGQGGTDGSSVDDTPRGPVRADITDGTEIDADFVDDPQEDDKVVISENDKPYLALGADLNVEQKSTVLSLMGIDPANLGDYKVATVTNQEEHEYLDAYLSASTIGTRALSSVVIVKRGKGDGIHISTKNISYCTVGMYKNALATAGLEDADVIVAGPFPLSGTAALIGAMKAYADMEGAEMDLESLDAAMNEIVVTGELNESMGDDAQTEEFMAYVKQQVLEEGKKDAAGIQDIIAQASEKFDFSLSESEKEKVVSLMQKIGSLDIDVDKLLEQAGSIYDSLKEMEENTGILASIAAFFKGILEAVVNFFKGLF